MTKLMILPKERDQIRVFFFNKKKQTYHFVNRKRPNLCSCQYMATSVMAFKALEGIFLRDKIEDIFEG